jgi:hypothetical protein
MRERFLGELVLNVAKLMPLNFAVKDSFPLQVA